MQMKNLTLRLPPLNALRAFWVVMRKGSFRAAADRIT
jgi:LysR family glycine cleavage system transcriptional activator